MRLCEAPCIQRKRRPFWLRDFVPACCNGEPVYILRLRDRRGHLVAHYAGQGAGKAELRQHLLRSESGMGESLRLQDAFRRLAIRCAPMRNTVERPYRLCSAPPFRVVPRYRKPVLRGEIGRDVRSLIGRSVGGACAPERVHFPAERSDAPAAESHHAGDEWQDISSCSRIEGCTRSPGVGTCGVGARLPRVQQRLPIVDFSRLRIPRLHRGCLKSCLNSERRSRLARTTDTSCRGFTNDRANLPASWTGGRHGQADSLLVRPHSTGL
jgi:hypothetical protein